MVEKKNLSRRGWLSALENGFALAARIIAVAIVLLGGLIWQAHDVLRPAVYGPLLVTAPAARTILDTRDRAPSSPWMHPYDTLGAQEIAAGFASYHIQVDAQNWDLWELRLVYEAVHDLGARLAEIGPDDGPTMMYQTLGRVRFRRTHRRGLLDRIARAQFGPAKAWTTVNTITIYDSVFYYDYLEIKATLVHELGHVWDWHTRGRASRWLRGYVGAEAKPSLYAAKIADAGEEWAETVSAWVYPAYARRNDHTLGTRHRQYLESLALHHVPPTRLSTANPQLRLVSWHIGLGAALSSAVFLRQQRRSLRRDEKAMKANRQELEHEGRT